MTEPAAPDWFHRDFQLIEAADDLGWSDLSALADRIDHNVPVIAVQATSARAVIASLISGWRTDRPVWLQRGAGDTGALASAGDGFAVWLESSGTTGNPKRVRHLIDRLAGRLRTTGDRSACWLLSYEPGSFAGLQVILTALASGARLVSEPAAALGQLAALAAARRVTHISGTPSFWRGFLMACPDPAPDLMAITTGGEAVDQALLDRLISNFPNARLRHIYASTEAGALFSVSDGRAGFPAAWLNSGIDGVGLRVTEGILQVLSPRALTRMEQGNGLLADGWIDTGDLVEIVGDRAVFTGRRDGQVNVGGVKVSPEQVEQVILGLAGVSDALVTPRANPITGYVLSVEIVLAQNAVVDDVRMALRAALAGLPPAARPRLISFVDQIDLAASGKKRRAPVARGNQG